MIVLLLLVLLLLRWVLDSLAVVFGLVGDALLVSRILLLLPSGLLLDRGTTHLSVPLVRLLIRLCLFGFERAQNNGRRPIPSPNLFDVTQESFLTFENLPDRLFIVLVVQVVGAVAENALALQLFLLED